MFLIFALQTLITVFSWIYWMLPLPNQPYYREGIMCTILKKYLNLFICYMNCLYYDTCETKISGTRRFKHGRSLHANMQWYFAYDKKNQNNVGWLVTSKINLSMIYICLGWYSNKSDLIFRRVSLHSVIPQVNFMIIVW